MVRGAGGLTARKAVTVGHRAWEAGGGVGYVSTAAAATEDDVFEGWYFDIVADGHG